MPAKKKPANAGRAKAVDAGDSAATTRADGARRRMKKGKGRKEEVQEVEEPPPPPKPEGPPPIRPDEELFETVRFQALIDSESAIGTIYQQIKDGEDVNQYNLYGFTPLAIASAAGNAPLVSLLLEKSASVAMGSIGRAELPLHHAANFGHRLVCQLLAEPARKAGVVDVPNSTGYTPLHLTASSGHAPCLRVLLTQRADVSTRNRSHGQDTAMHAAARGDHEMVLETLLAHEADVNATDTLGRSPLHIAAGRANGDCVSLLLRSRADPHLRGYGDLSPLDNVPSEHVGRDRTVKLLQSYMRPDPSDPRVDLRFDIRDSRDILAEASDGPLRTCPGYGVSAVA